MFTAAIETNELICNYETRNDFQVRSEIKLLLVYLKRICTYFNNTSFRVREAYSLYNELYNILLQQLNDLYSLT